MGTEEAVDVGRSREAESGNDLLGDAGAADEVAAPEGFVVRGADEAPFPPGAPIHLRGRDWCLAALEGSARIRRLDGSSVVLNYASQGEVQVPCDRFIGTSSKGLEPGDYILQAVLAVPKEGDGWTITLATDCTTTKGDSTTNKSDSKDYELKYPGEGRGYKLVPLRRIKSPGTYGAQSCSWKITAPHPDGDKVYEGEWSVPEGA